MEYCTVSFNFIEKKKLTKQKLQLQRNPWLNHSPNFCSQTTLLWVTITYCANIKCVFWQTIGNLLESDKGGMKVKYNKSKNKTVSSCSNVAFRVFSHNTNLIKFRHLPTTQMLCKLQ